jgi:hypothetical protein
MQHGAFDLIKPTLVSLPKSLIGKQELNSREGDVQEIRDTLNKSRYHKFLVEPSRATVPAPLASSPAVSLSRRRSSDRAVSSPNRPPLPPSGNPLLFLVNESGPPVDSNAAGDGDGPSGEGRRKKPVATNQSKARVRAFQLARRAMSSELRGPCVETRRGNRNRAGDMGRRSAGCSCAIVC